MGGWISLCIACSSFVSVFLSGGIPMSERKMDEFSNHPISEYIFRHLRDERLGMEGDATCLNGHLFEEGFKVERRGDGVSSISSSRPTWGRVRDRPLQICVPMSL